jgi:hypothetical protein
MLGEHVEHVALVARLEMEEAVPSEHAIKPPAKAQ